jgi:hypothetical protein
VALIVEASGLSTSNRRSPRRLASIALGLASLLILH